MSTKVDDYHGRQKLWFVKSKLWNAPRTIIRQEYVHLTTDLTHAQSRNTHYTLLFKIDCTTALGNHQKSMLRTLNAKLERVWATPGLDSYRLPALSNTVTLDVGWPLSTAATLKPGAASTTVAKPRLDAVTRRVALSIAFGLFVCLVFFARSLFETFRRRCPLGFSRV